MINKTTFMANSSNVTRKWYVIDATGIPLGRLSSVVATILRGKNKPQYTPHADAGDFVIVINAKDVVLTGNKAKDKLYRRHSGWAGGLKTTTAGELREKNPVKLLETSIKGMLPHNTLGRAQGMKLHVYADGEHNHAAQKPETLDISGLI